MALGYEYSTLAQGLHLYCWSVNLLDLYLMLTAQESLQEKACGLWALLRTSGLYSE
jgi:hypothetical protein